MSIGIRNGNRLQKNKSQQKCRYVNRLHFLECKNKSIQHKWLLNFLIDYRFMFLNWCFIGLGDTLIYPEMGYDTLSNKTIQT